MNEETLELIIKAGGRAVGPLRVAFELMSVPCQGAWLWKLLSKMTLPMVNFGYFSKMFIAAI